MKITTMHARRGQNVVKRGQPRVPIGIGQYRIVRHKRKEAVLCTASFPQEFSNEEKDTYDVPLPIPTPSSL